MLLSSLLALPRRLTAQNGEIEFESGSNDFIAAGETNRNSIIGQGCSLPTSVVCGWEPEAAFGVAFALGAGLGGAVTMKGRMDKCTSWTSFSA